MISGPVRIIKYAIQSAIVSFRPFRYALKASAHQLSVNLETCVSTYGSCSVTLTGFLARKKKNHESWENICEDRIHKRPNQTQEIVEKWHDSNHNERKNDCHSHRSDPDNPVCDCVRLQVSRATKNSDKPIFCRDMAP